MLRTTLHWLSRILSACLLSLSIPFFTLPLWVAILFFCSIFHSLLHFTGNRRPCPYGKSGNSLQTCSGKLYSLSVVWDVLARCVKAWLELTSLYFIHVWEFLVAIINWKERIKWWFEAQYTEFAHELNTYKLSAPRFLGWSTCMSESTHSGRTVTMRVLKDTFCIIWLLPLRTCWLGAENNAGIATRF